MHNTGAAFGLLNGVDLPFKTAAAGASCRWRRWSGLAMLRGVAAGRAPAGARGLALVVGGAAGNLIDRMWLGYVVDFVDVYWGGWHFWAFNVADAAITVGVALMILDLMGVGRHAVSRTV